MGGFIRKVFSTFIQKPPAAQVVQAPVQTPVAAPAAPIVAPAAAQTLAKKTMQNKSILTSSKGIEDEANVSKTVLGGGKKKKIIA